jgi:YesN/AraC family two-component response regulator
MNVVIVEDEKEILNGMNEVIGELRDLIDQVHAFDNGEEALQYINVHKPNMIITDIVLPRTSGLEMIEQIVSKGYHPKIVIVSGYNNFEYAQRGIKLGVHDYILKPFDKQQFHTVVVGMVDAILEERQQLQRRDPAASALGAKTLRDKFLHGLCMKMTALHEHVYHRLKFWSLDWLAVTDYSVLAIDVAGLSDRSLAEMETDLTSFAIGNIVDEIIRDYPPSVLFRNARNQWCLITGTAELDRLTDEIAEKVATYHKVTVRIGISSTTGGVQSLAAAYEQATRALQMCILSKKAVKQYYVSLDLREGETENHAERIALCIMALDMSGIAAAVDTMIKELALRNRAHDIRELSRVCLECLAELHASLSQRFASSLHHVPLELWEALDQCDSFESLRACIVDYLQQLARKISSTHSHFMIEKAKRLIDSNYAENITLQGIAETLSVHPVWLSQLFKRECQINFVDYLADVRIEHAKWLLRESDLKIYEIVRAVGYQDLQHFGQIFKKKTGLSPKEFRFGR